MRWSGYDPVRNIYRVGPMYFRQWFAYFFDECYDCYKEYCSSGSIKKEKTLKRIELMELSFTDYFELNNPNESELKNTVSEESPPDEISLSDNGSTNDNPPVGNEADRAEKISEKMETE